ncbi:MAG: hypothetical protein HY830_25040 [Actinobacteria bacterium]|nr:hypothetical protein [Actinomycetota bacterium]
MNDPTPEELDRLLAEGNARIADGDPEGAVPVLEQALEVCRVLVEETVVARSVEPRVLGRIAMALSLGGEPAEAVRVGRRAYELTGSLYGDDYDCTLVDVALAAVNFARFLAADGHGDEALECAYYGLQHLDELVPGAPLTYLGWRAALLQAVAEVEPESDEEPWLTPLAARRDLVATCRRLVDLDPAEPQYATDLAEALLLLAKAVSDEPSQDDTDGDGEVPDDEPAAVRTAREAVGILHGQAAPPSGLNALARGLSVLAGLLSDEGRDDDAEAFVAQVAAGFGEPWASRLPLLVVTWEWALAPTFGSEQSVLEFNDDLRDPDADDVVEFAFADLPPTEATRLRALRVASRELGVAEAYSRRAEDPLGFLVTYA